MRLIIHISMRAIKIDALPFAVDQMPVVSMASVIVRLGTRGTLITNAA